MFTPIDYFNDCCAIQLDYLYDVAQKYVPSYDVNRETGKYEECETTAIQQFILRYNHKAIKRMDKVTKYMEDKDIQEYLQALNVDVEKFWYLLLFVYDYSFGQCINNIVINCTPKEEIEALIQIITGVQEPKYIGSTAIDINLKEPVMLQVGKDEIPLNGIVASFIADACKKYLEICGDMSLLNSASSNGELDNMGFTKMAYHFCYMLKWFFDSIGVKRKEGATFSNNEKGLLCHLLYLTEICTNENLLKYRMNEYSTLKGFIKPKTIPEFAAMNSYYR